LSRAISYIHFWKYLIHIENISFLYLEMLYDQTLIIKKAWICISQIIKIHLYFRFWIFLKTFLKAILQQLFSIFLFLKDSFFEIFHFFDLNDFFLVQIISKLNLFILMFQVISLCIFNFSTSLIIALLFSIKFHQHYISFLLILIST